jgi:tRNA(adenine34) deaminase
VGGRFFPRDEYFMQLAIREAQRAPEHGDVPIGAVVSASCARTRRRTRR